MTHTRRARFACYANACARVANWLSMVTKRWRAPPKVREFPDEAATQHAEHIRASDSDPSWAAGLLVFAAGVRRIFTAEELHAYFATALVSDQLPTSRPMNDLTMCEAGAFGDDVTVPDCPAMRAHSAQVDALLTCPSPKLVRRCCRSPLRPSQELVVPDRRGGWHEWRSEATCVRRTSAAGDVHRAADEVTSGGASFVTVVQAAHFPECDHVTLGEAPHASRRWSVFRQREMCATSSGTRSGGRWARRTPPGRRPSSRHMGTRSSAGRRRTP